MIITRTFLLGPPFSSLVRPCEFESEFVHFALSSHFLLICDICTLARALRTLASAIAEVVGPSQWGLQVQVPDIQEDARAALEYIFQVGHSAHSVYY